MATVLTLDTGKATVKDATVKMVVDPLSHIGTEDEALIVDLRKFVILSITGTSGTSTRCWLLGAAETGHR
jgi:hypothetical protein